MSEPFHFRDLATPRLQALARQIQPGPQRRALIGRLGKTLEVDLKKHFAERDQEGNARGFPRQHWWAREVRAKTALRTFDDKRATVGIASRQFAFRVRGGTIKPGPGKRALALPLRAEAYGTRPSADTIPGLFLVRSRILGKAWLAAREGDALRFYWRLVPQVTQKPDPKALPPQADLQASLHARAAGEIARIVRQYPA